MAVKWGFIGAGRIVPRFMTGLVQVKDAVPEAIYARNKAKAQIIADEYGFKEVYDNIDEFVAKADIDIAYIATPHAQHLEFALKLLEAKIPVLCEKAMGPNREHVQKMIDCAKKNDVFLAEAFWTRMFPVTRKAAEWISEGKIGNVVAANGVFAFKAEEKKGDRVFDPEYAGGTLLDIGVYLIQEANLMFGEAPKEAVSLCTLGELGTDIEAGIALKYSCGRIATLLMSFKTNGADTFTVYGTEGRIEIFEDFWRPRKARITTAQGITDFGSDSDFSGEGYQFEIEHIQDCLKKGLNESPLITHKQSLEIVTTCDEIRAQWGLKYPFEK